MLPFAFNGRALRPHYYVRPSTARRTLALNLGPIRAVASQRFALVLGPWLVTMPAIVRAALVLAQPTARACRFRRMMLCRTARPAPRGLRRCCAAAEGTSSDASDTVRVDGLPDLDSICDDFVCKSSPAIESTLRQARQPRAPQVG